MKLLVMRHDRHGRQPMLKMRATPAANLVGVLIDRTDTARLGMVATKSKLQRARERVGYGSSQRQLRCRFPLKRRFATTFYADARPPRICKN